ncbi:MAG: zinc ribbon domain-containing protein [Promethearchaeota archaeon]
MSNNFSEKKLVISIIFILIVIYQIFPYAVSIQAQSDSWKEYYDHEIELKYDTPTKLAETSISSDNFFEVWGILSFTIRANFSSNNGTIWLQNQNEETIWKEALNNPFDKHISGNESSKQYSLWANSSTLGTDTLYYSFYYEVFHGPNIGAIIITIFLLSIPGIICVILIGMRKSKDSRRRKKEPRAVSTALRIGETLQKKYEVKHPEKAKRVLEDKSKMKKIKTCPKCGAINVDIDDDFCRECGFKFR